MEIAGIAASANKLRMSQIGMNLTAAVEGILRGKRYLIHDPDPLFTTEFLAMLAEVGGSALIVNNPVWAQLQPFNRNFCGVEVPDAKHTQFSLLSHLWLREAGSE